MKKIFSILAMCVCSGMLHAQSLRNGTPVFVHITNELNSKRPTDAVVVVSQDVVVNGVVVIKKGTQVKNKTKIQKAGRMGQPGSIVVECKSVVATDGQIIALSSGDIDIEGKDRKNQAVAGTLLVSPFALARKGKNVVIAAGTPISDVSVLGNYPLDLSNE